MDNADIARNLMASFHRFRHIFRPHRNPFPGLKPSDVGVLFHIREGCREDPDGVSVTKLSKVLHVTSPSITQTVSSLEERGLVARKMDEEDRRGVKVSLTDKGLEMTHGAENQLLSMLTGLVEHLGPERSALLAGLLDDMTDYLSHDSIGKGAD